MVGVLCNTTYIGMKHTKKRIPTRRKGGRGGGAVTIPAWAPSLHAVHIGQLYNSGDSNFDTLPCDMTLPTAAGVHLFVSSIVSLVALYTILLGHDVRPRVERLLYPSSGLLQCARRVLE